MNPLITPLTQFAVFLLVVELVFHIPGVVLLQPEDTSFQDSDAVDDLQNSHPVAENLLRGCECWKWPECVSNCTINPILQAQLRTHHLLLASLPRPFVLVFPYQDRKTRSKYGTSTAGKRGTHFMHTKFWINLPNQQHVLLRVQKSRIFGHTGTHTTLYYQRNRDGQTYPFASSKPDHCFYTGTVRRNPDRPEMNSYVAVDTCQGLRGLIQIDNQTYSVLPLHCTECHPGRLPHVVFPQESGPVERDVKLPVFWRPTGVLSRKPSSPKTTGEQLYIIRLAVILDHSLYNTLGEELDRSIHYIGSVGNLATKSFLGLPIELRLMRSEVWNLENRLHINSSIKTTLNHLALYSIRRGVHLNNATETADTEAKFVRPGGIQTHRNRVQRIHRRAASSAITSPHLEQQDFEVLLTSTTFTDPVEYLAVPDSICTPRSLAVIQVNTSESAYRTAQLLALAISDALGLKSFPCPPRYSCTSLDPLSEGDKSRIRLALFSGMADCLITNSNEETTSHHVDTCGNGRLDRGEECDVAGSTQNVDGNGNWSMPCCNVHTCLADVGATCTHGECCNHCEFAPRGQLCRSALDQCDFPEFCTGVQPDCPVDIYLENGFPCRVHPSPVTADKQYNLPQPDTLNEITALCYQGNCPTRESQCRSIWGSNSRKAADYCFMLHNTRTAGACGVAEANCEREHAMCGLLHCQGGEPRPVSKEAQMGQPFLTYTEHGGQQFECKHLSHASTVRFVPEGAACAANQYCFQQQCVSPHIALRSRCPAGPTSSHTADGHTPVQNITCSGHGLCTNGGYCFCYSGWGGNACQHQISTSLSMNDSTSANHAGTAYEPDPDIAVRIWAYMEAMKRTGYEISMANNEASVHTEKKELTTLYLVTILGSVVGGMFVFLAVFVLIYRYRGSSAFVRKARRSRCFKWHKDPGNIIRLEETTDRRPFRLYTSKNEPTELPYPALSPDNSSSSRKRSSGSVTTDRPYLSRWSCERRCVSSHLFKHHNKRGIERRESSQCNHDHQGRRRRRHHRSSRSDGERSRINRRSAKHTESTSDYGRDTLLDANGMNHSDTELAIRHQSPVEEDSISIDRIIKFGSMPSYKEDKLRHERCLATSASANVAHAATDSPLPSVQSAVPSAECSSAFTSSYTGGKLSTKSRFYAITTAPSIPPPLFPLVMSTLGPTESGSSYHWNAAVAGQPQSTAVMCATSALVEAGKAGAAVATLYSSPTSTLVHNDRSGHILKDAREDMNESQFSILMENSWRQPEKGILKNKNEGGGITSPNTGTFGNKCGKQQPSSKHRHHRGRHHSHGHHHRRQRTHSHDSLKNKSEDDCRASRDSLCSECSCSLYNEPGDRCRSVPSSGHTHSRSQTPRKNSREFHLRSRSEEDVHHSGSSTGSLSSQSSTSSSFSPIDMNQDMLSSSSSTTSTCSTALEVVPEGTTPRTQTADKENQQMGIRSDRTMCWSRRGEVGRRLNVEEHSESDLLESNNHRCHHRRHHHCNNRHHRHHVGRHGKHHKRRRHRQESRSEAVSTSCASTIAVTISESSGSSSLGTTNGASRLSGASSSSSGLTPRPGSHLHRRHRRVHTRRSTDEEATTSGSHGSPLPPVPTILCNAGQQTDEMSLLKAAGLTVPIKRDTLGFEKATKRGSRKEPEESDGEWEEVECSESACEECQATSEIRTTVRSQPGPPGSSPTTVDITLGHTNPAYLQTIRSNGGEASMSNPSIAGYQQQSTASSSLSSSKNSRNETPVMIFNPQSMYPSASVSQSPQGSVSTKSQPKSGVTNRAASSSSCSSSSMAGQPLLQLPRSQNNAGKPANSDEFTNQNSETEVDAHLHIHPIGSGRSAGPFCSSTSPHLSGILPLGVGYSLASQSYAPRPLMRDVLPIGMNYIPNSKIPPPQGSPFDRPHVHPLPSEKERNQCLTDNGETYYQHPYEDVATDEYAEASSGRSVQPSQQHIYHQHGVLNESLSTDANGCTYSKGDEDDDEQLSLDEGHSGVPNIRGIVTNALLRSYQSHENYPRLNDPRLSQHPSWPNSTEIGGYRLDGMIPGGFMLPPQPGPRGSLNPQPNSAERSNDGSKLHSDVDDCGSEFSISAFRRDDIQIANRTRSSNGFGLRNLTLPPHPRHAGGAPTASSSDFGTDVRSNDGTCDESDASSLPEAGCDLVQLAQLDISSRPNPLLNDLARQQASSRRWLSPAVHETKQSRNPQTALYKPSVGYSACQSYTVTEGLPTSISQSKANNR